MEGGKTKGPFDGDLEELEEYELARVFREEYDSDEEYELEHGEDYRPKNTSKREE